MPTSLDIRRYLCYIEKKKLRSLGFTLSTPNKVRRSNAVTTNYYDILTVEEADLDCLSLEALFVELLCEEELARPALLDLSESF